MSDKKTSKLENGEFVKALENVKVPLLVLDEKWHHLFVGVGKSKEVAEWETKVNDLLKLQGKLNQDLKDLKKLKTNLMNSIVDNMDDGSSDGNDALRQKKMEENKRLIDEINVKMEEAEDQLLDIPRSLDEANKMLMIYSMDLCYKKLRTNAAEIEEIGTWIKRIRVELKKNIIIKQADEQKNEEIYTYMHAILGPKMLDVFDLKYEEDGEVLDT
ncbi:MAG: hypothetical protein E7280_02505 [Lachnospiraceae bacterium]|jgi:hypothetical protein|nr:hypothetical protein [Lachnospiraceae bacterium]